MEKARGFFDTFGGWTLLLSWVPIIGDPLTFIAGVLRYNFKRFVLIVAVAKRDTLRYSHLFSKQFVRIERTKRYKRQHSVKSSFFPGKSRLFFSFYDLIEECKDKYTLCAIPTILVAIGYPNEYFRGMATNNKMINEIPSILLIRRNFCNSDIFSPNLIFVA